MEMKDLQDRVYPHALRVQAEVMEQLDSASAQQQRGGADYEEGGRFDGGVPLPLAPVFQRRHVHHQRIRHRAAQPHRPLHALQVQRHLHLPP
eukprot:CAMPEP_0177759490 /NCGR_PEP_ID=MMETSP0491_2-20121128/4763_1 /TAXON_ID=63592 /ORGANISM="Tetraselmis chuii, Strain PLY429" /LENGTH=91 /DNA_ID=CAMNT_0019275329 /DNA_START=733 /DNA_END=1009 /DNA_ORIENTATION=-